MFIWNLYAKAYDVINKNMPYLKMLDEVIGELDLNGHLKILDAGCGTGNLEAKIIKENSNAEIRGIDLSEEMLNKAKKKFINKPNISFQLANLNNKLNFSNNSFDRIVSINALYALDNPEEAISEFHLLLKPQGKLIFTNPHNQAKFSAIFKGQFKELGLVKFILKFLANLPALSIIIFVNIFFLRKNKNYWNKNQTEKILSEKGFKNIQIKYTYAGQDLLVSAVK